MGRFVLSPKEVQVWQDKANDLPQGQPLCLPCLTLQKNVYTLSYTSKWGWGLVGFPFIFVIHH